MEEKYLTPEEKLKALQQELKELVVKKQKEELIQLRQELVKEIQQAEETLINNAD
jgi:hypothetical protein